MPHYLLYCGPLRGVHHQYLIDEAPCFLRNVWGMTVPCLHNLLLQLLSGGWHKTVSPYEHKIQNDTQALDNLHGALIFFPLDDFQGQDIGECPHTCSASARP